MAFSASPTMTMGNFPISPPSAIQPTMASMVSPMQTNSTSSTTRILVLTGFSPELKTRDIQACFSDYESAGFKIKWIDDTSCYLVFEDPVTAKKAFLSTLANMPSRLVDTSAESNQSIPTIRAYSGPDTAHILTTVQTRARSRSTVGPVTMTHTRKPSSGNPSTAGPRRESFGGARPQPSSNRPVTNGVNKDGTLPGGSPPRKAPLAGQEAVPHDLST